jgi:hypothetical protein
MRIKRPQAFARNEDSHRLSVVVPHPEIDCAASTKRLRVILLKFDHDGERHMKIIKIIAAAASLLILAAVPASAQTAEAALKSADGKDVEQSS